MDRNGENNYYDQYPSINQQSSIMTPKKSYFNKSFVDSNLNPRQLFWIKKRKIRREALDAQMQSKDSNYIYESRHRHAMKRRRAASGRFLTKQELERLDEENNEK